MFKEVKIRKQETKLLIELNDAIGVLVIITNIRQENS